MPDPVQIPAATAAKRPMPPIQGKRVRLRLLEESDLPLTLSWRNRDSVRIWFTHSEVLTPETHRAWFENYRTRDDDFVFIIELPTDNGAPRAVGQVSVYDIDWSRRTAEIGRLLVGEPDAERRGYGVEAFRLFCGHLFVELGIRELRAKVLPQNARSLALCRRCGFTRQGMSHGLVDLTLHSCDWPPVWLRNKVA